MNKISRRHALLAFGLNFEQFDRRLVAATGEHTIIIDNDLLERAREATRIQETTALVRAGLEALVAYAARKRLAALGGTQPDLRRAPRRRLGAA